MLAVFGDEGHTCRHGVLRRRGPQGHAIDPDFAGQQRFNAEDGPGEFRPPRTDQPGKAEDFALAHGKAHFLGGETAGARAIKREAVVAARRGWRQVKRLQGAADHEGDHGLRGDLLLRQCSRKPSVAQNHHAIGNLHHFVQPVGDEDDAHAAFPQFTDDVQKPARLAEGEAGGGLIHDDETRIEGECAGNLHKLALGDRQFRHGRGRPEVGAQPLQQRFHLCFALALIDEHIERPAARFAADEDVRRNAEIGEGVELLVDEGNAPVHGLACRGKDGFRTVQQNAPGGWRDDAAEYLHQGRFSGAILADEPDHFPAPDAE